MKYSFPFLFSIALLAVFQACKGPEEPKSPGLDFIRYDRLLMEMDTGDIRAGFRELESIHPEFTDIYFRNVLPIPGFDDRNEDFFTELKGFIQDEKIRAVYELCQSRFDPLDTEIKAFEKAFEKAKNWFPGIQTPVIYTFISEFAMQRFIFEIGNRDGLAIGLDLFLGDVFDYSRLESGSNAFSSYLTRTYDRDHLVRKTMHAWLEDQLGAVKGDRLIDHMIFNGTSLYILDDILEVPDTVLTEYPAEKLQWLESNEKELWSFYFQNDWFYTTDQYVIKRLVNPAPNTTALGMPAKAPGQTGNYLGWQIVRKYIQRYPETTIETLIKTDAQKILELSKYKPRN